jgi:hypothetical protein
MGVATSKARSGETMPGSFGDQGDLWLYGKGTPVAVLAGGRPCSDDQWDRPGYYRQA